MIPDRFKPYGLRWYILYRLGLKAAYTQTSSNEQQCLKSYASGKRRIAEIGVYMGVNTRSFRESMHEQGVLIAVDPYFRSVAGLLGAGWTRRIAHAEVAKSERGTVVWVETLGSKATMIEAVQTHLPIEFLFIDGDHSWEGIAGDWDAWSGQIAPDGIVALHDSINSGRCGSEQFTHEVILVDPRFEYIESIDTTTIMRRWE